MSGLHPWRMTCIHAFVSHVYLCAFLSLQLLILQRIWFSCRFFFFLSYCVGTENFLTSWFIGLHKHLTNPNLMRYPPFFPQATLFRPLMPLIEICRRLWGQQIHCSEGATSESDLFDLSMALVSNKLTSNRGYLVWLGAICAGIINWPNSGIYGETCALSLLKLFVEGKCSVQGSCLKWLWLSTRMMNFRG